MSRLLTRGIVQQIINLSGGGNVTPNPVNWSNIVYDAIEDSYTINVQQITLIDSPITLSITFAAAQMIINYRIDTTAPAWTNGGSYGGSGSGFTQILNGNAVLTINNNEYLSFFCEPDLPINASTTVTITNTSDGNAVLDQFEASIERFVDAPCYLTTACVEYKGLADDGPELTAMRTLREYYRGDEYYDNLINEYYEKSPIILNNIPENEFDDVMDNIYDSVKLVEFYVSNNEFQSARDEYLNLYFQLRNQYS